MILLALYRQWDRAQKKTRSLSTTLYELKRLVANEGWGCRDMRWRKSEQGAAMQT